MRIRVDVMRVVGCAVVVAVAGCSGSNAMSDAPTLPVDGPGHTPGMPGVGAHAVAYYGLFADDRDSISTPSLAIQPSGSTIIVSTGRGDITAVAPPTDNKGNGPYPQLGITHNYTHWKDSGTALHGLASVTGGADFQVTVSNRPSDEVTLAAVEIVEGTRIVDHQWNEVVQPETPVLVTSKAVTTTGPATLVAFWWGDAPEPGNKTAVPNNGFTVIDSILKEGALVQCAVAVKNVAAAGTYDVTWTATPVQGAQLYLVAVQ